VEVAKIGVKNAVASQGVKAKDGIHRRCKAVPPTTGCRHPPRGLGRCWARTWPGQYSRGKITAAQRNRRDGREVRDVPTAVSPARPLGPETAAPQHERVDRVGQRRTTSGDEDSHTVKLMRTGPRCPETARSDPGEPERSRPGGGREWKGGMRPSSNGIYRLTLGGRQHEQCAPVAERSWEYRGTRLSGCPNTIEDQRPDDQNRGKARDAISMVLTAHFF